MDEIDNLMAEILAPWVIFKKMHHLEDPQLNCYEHTAALFCEGSGRSF